MIEAYMDKLEEACRQKGIEKFEIRYRQEANTTLQDRKSTRLNSSH